MKIVFESEFAKLAYEEDLKLLSIIWTDKKPSFEDYQRPFQEALQYMDLKQVENYISDIRNQGVISPDYRKWLQEIAIPDAAKKGLKRIVGVAELNIFKRYYINNVFNSAKKFGMPFKLFDTPEEAKKWFKKFD
ncbi:MAG: hypothetical protein GQ564_00470 [Bacteroidales bacterium]|nr:hypothetical protein [Bacteroidales bacterium]